MVPQITKEKNTKYNKILEITQRIIEEIKKAQSSKAIVFRQTQGRTIIQEKI